MQIGVQKERGGGGMGGGMSCQGGEVGGVGTEVKDVFKDNYVTSESGI